MRIRWTLLAVLLSLAGCAEQGTPVVEIIDERARAVVDETAELTVLGEGYLWTEGPLWIDNGGYLLFSDIPNNVIHRFDPGSGVSVYLRRSGATGLHDNDSGSGSNGLLLNKEGELVLFQQGDRRVAVMDAPLTQPAAQFVTLAGQFEGSRLNSPNDGVYHSDGSLYFTDPPYGLDDTFDDARRQLPYQGVFRLTVQGDLQLLDDSVTAPNGIALSNDEQTLYVAVSDDDAAHWLAYDVLPGGGLTNKRVFFDVANASKLLAGLPDGMVVHSSGFVFASGPGGVWLFSPAGELLARIYTGRLTANCTLSADERTLYLTAHDQLMSLPLKAL